MIVLIVVDDVRCEFGCLVVCIVCYFDCVCMVG